MADPTDYDKLQDEEIETLKDIVTTQEQAPSGGEYSYPIPDMPMDQDQWSELMKSFGSGIISFGQYPYRLIVDDDADETNMVRITPATDVDTKDSVGVVEGYAHRLTEDKLLEVPAVGTTTKYTVALQYDPIRAVEGHNPVILDMFAGDLDESQGKKYVLIYESERKQSTVLSSMTWTPVRSRLAPSITVQRESHLPNPKHSGLIWGTRCYCSATHEEWMLIHDDDSPYMKWEKIHQEWTDWTNPGDTATYEWPGSGHRRGYRHNGETTQLRGRIQKKDGTDFINGGGGNGRGYQMYVISSVDARPAVEQRFITASAGWQGQKLCVITVSPDGTVYGQPILGDAKWMGLDGINVALGRD